MALLIGGVPDYLSKLGYPYTLRRMNGPDTKGLKEERSKSSQARYS